VSGGQDADETQVATVCFRNIITSMSKYLRQSVSASEQVWTYHGMGTLRGLELERLGGKKRRLMGQTTMNKHTRRGKNTSAGSLGTFRKFFAAVAAFDVCNMGARAILATLVKRAGDSNRAKALGIHDTLTVCEIAARIQTRAKAKDPVAYAELLFLSTFTTALLAEVTDEQREMAIPFVQASTTFPILQPYYNSSKSDTPLDRLKAMGFGENARAGRLRMFTNGFGLVALLLHLHGILQRLVHGNERQGLPETDDEGPAFKMWKTSARPTLDGAFAKLGDLPLDEIANLKGTRQNLVRGSTKVEVSGYARHEIKEWFIKLRKLTHGLLRIASQLR